MRGQGAGRVARHAASSADGRRLGPRDQKRAHPESAGVSKSNVSRLFATEGGRVFDAFRQRDIARDDWLILTLDGVRLADEVWAVVAPGVAGDGAKQTLDFEVRAPRRTPKWPRRFFRALRNGALRPRRAVAFCACSTARRL